MTADATQWMWLVAIAVAAVVGAWCGALVARRRSQRDTWARLRRWRRRTREAQSEAETLAQLLDETFKVVHIGLLQIDDVRRVRAANPTSLEWFGVELDTAPTLMTVAGSAELRDVVDRAISGGSGDDTNARVTIRNSVYRVQVAPLADGGALLALRDDTELAQLTRAQRDLVDSFSHDLRTPLASIKLLAENLSGTPGDDPDTRDTLTARLNEQVDSLTEMADNLLDLSRLESGRVLLKLRPENLRVLAEAAVASLDPQLDESLVSVSVEIPDGTSVLVDATQIVRVFGNLIDNARIHSSPGSEVVVGACEAADDLVEVFVVDDGPGISPADADRVFERFYRGDRSRGGGGKGLGLAIALHIVNGHGGHVWVDTAAAVGATIRFTLPSSPQP